MSRSKRLAAAKRRGRSGRGIPMESAHLLGQGLSEREQRQVLAAKFHMEGREVAARVFAYMSAGLLLEECRSTEDGTPVIDGEIIDEMLGRHQLSRFAAACHLTGYGVPLKEAFRLCNLPTENAVSDSDDEEAEVKDESDNDADESENPEFDGAHIIGEDQDPPPGSPPKIIVE